MIIINNFNIRYLTLIFDNPIIHFMVNPDRLETTLPVSFGMAYMLAELLSRPLHRALLRCTEPYGRTVMETWIVDNGESFQIAQDERLARAKQSQPIGSIEGLQGQKVLVFQQRPSTETSYLKKVFTALITLSGVCWIFRR